MIENCFGQLEWRMRSLDIGIHKCLDVVQLRRKLRCCCDIGTQPSLYQLDLVAKMDRRRAEGGRIEGGFLDYDRTTVIY